MITHHKENLMCDFKLTRLDAVDHLLTRGCPSKRKKTAIAPYIIRDYGFYLKPERLKKLKEFAKKEYIRICTERR